MTEKELSGKGVVSLSDGAKVGSVKDLVFDGLRLDALSVRGERGEGLLTFANIRSVGEDAITIESYRVIDWNAGKALAPTLTTLHDLRKLPVVDDGGTALGKLHDVLLDASGSVSEIRVRTEGVFGIGAHETVVPSDMVLALGPQLITVKQAVRLQSDS